MGSHTRRLVAVMALVAALLVPVAAAVVPAGPAAAAAGGFDPGFGENGRVLTDLGSAEDRGGGAAVQDDGRVVVAAVSGSDVAVVRYEADGTLDTAFGTAGVAEVALGGPDTAARVAVQDDGGIVVAADTAGDLGVARLDPTGVADPAFDGDGVAAVDLGGVDRVAGIGLQAVGAEQRIVVAGTSGGNVVLARLLPDGGPDPGFGTGGSLVTDLGPTATVGEIDARPTGRILVAATVAGDFAVVRYLTDGTLDTSFAGDGIRRLNMGGADAARGLAVQANGRTVVVGRRTLRGRVDFAAARLNTDGTLHTAFSGDGKLIIDFGGTDRADDAVIEPSGKIVIVGTSRRANRPSGFAVAKLRTNGTFDPGFAGDGTKVFAFGETGPRTTPLIHDGALLIVGTETEPTESAEGTTGTDLGAVQLASDTTAPELIDLDITPSTVDTSAGPAEITFEFRVTDDLSGYEGGGPGVLPPGVGRDPIGGWGGQERVLGTALDGVYRDVLTLPRYSPQGTWAVGQVNLIDAVGNHRALTLAQLTAAGFPTTFEQTGEGDTTPPQLVDLSFTPSEIDTSGGPAEITFEFRVTDDLSGVNPDLDGGGGVGAVVISPTGGFACCSTGTQLVSGTAWDGVYRDVLTLPRYSPQGTWAVGQVNLIDAVGNHRALTLAQLTAAGFPTTFEQTGEGDTTPPQLVDFSITPTEIDTSGGPAEITFEFRVTDDLSGVNPDLDGGGGVGAVVISPTGGSACCSTGTQLVSGTAWDGVYRDVLTLPQLSPHGTWCACQVNLYDAVGNFRALTRAQLTAAGFPTTFTNGPP